MALINKPDFKLASPYIPAKNIVAAYRPMANKIVQFDTSRTRHVLGLPSLYPLGDMYNGGSGALGGSGGMMMRMTDAPVDVDGYEVDLDAVLEKNGGLVPYLQLVREDGEKGPQIVVGIILLPI